VPRLVAATHPKVWLLTEHRTSEINAAFAGIDAA
jgi:hypothetical protein